MPLVLSADTDPGTSSWTTTEILPAGSAVGDLAYWTGSTWTTVAKSQLYDGTIVAADLDLEVKSLVNLVSDAARFITAPSIGFPTPSSPTTIPVYDTGPRVFFSTSAAQPVFTAYRGSAYLSADRIWMQINDTGGGTGNTWARVGQDRPTAVSDPGNGNEIAQPLYGKTVVTLNIGSGAETNTVAQPAFNGQQLTIQVLSDSGGTRVITFDHDIDFAGGFNVATFNDRGDTLFLEAVQGTASGTQRHWRMIRADSVTLT